MFNITSCNFADNSAIESGSGGVLYAFGSRFNISESAFTNNTAGYDGGAVATSESSFNICGIYGNGNIAAAFGGVIYGSNS